MAFHLLEKDPEAARAIHGRSVDLARTLAPDSVVPNLGASGAISGVIGAYLMLFPRNRVDAR